jgi:hypothetical protein
MAAFAVGFLVFGLCALAFGRFAVEWPLAAVFLGGFGGGIATAALAPRRPLRHAVEIGIVFVLARLAGLFGPASWLELALIFAGAWVAGFLRKLQLRRRGV